MSNPKTPSIPFPPLKDADGKPELVLGVRFDVGKFTIEITTGGAGAYLDMEIDGHAEITASELTALASWAESACKAMDKHNGECDAKVSEEEEQ
jgi:hypothetical protein